MSTEMVVNVSPRETRAALLENGVLQELLANRGDDHRHILQIFLALRCGDDDDVAPLAGLWRWRRLRLLRVSGRDQRRCCNGKKGD